MKIDEQDFVNAFDRMNRSENFSVVGRRMLFEYLTDVEKDTGKEMELDVISLCCAFTEYESIDEYCDTYDTSPLTRNRLNHAVKEILPDEPNYLEEILRHKHQVVITWYEYPKYIVHGDPKIFKMILSDE
tara:strand:+ start:163 stop:552 length:390 start_codon:yes stop_codon:yes gene_type:complete